jgi:flagellar biosynthesis/type III secretory pathway protein FliH
VSLTLLHRDGERSLALAGTRIERQVFKVLGSAQALWTEADAAVTRQQQQAQAEAELLREQAWERGYDDGRVDGISSVLGSLEMERRARALLFDRLVELVEQCVRSMLGSLGDAELFRQRVQHLVRNHRAAGSARLRVCPSQAHWALAAVAELIPVADGELPWLSVVVDDECAPDDLVLETRVGFVDASVVLTLEGARRVIEAALQRAEQGLSA